MTNDVKLGALCWNQYTDWTSLREAGIRADRLGYHSLWTWDHVYPIVGSHEGPIFEGYTVLGSWAAATETATIGLMVGANTFRNPALVVKTITALDHASGGRAVLGIGGAWFETEHTAFGLEFGESPGERLRWLEESVRIMRGMLHGDQPSGDRYYRVREVRNDPPPVQDHLPIVVGGGGVKRTLRIVARYADACNVGGGFESVRHKDEVLRQHCADVGRDESEIERTAAMGVCVIRDDPDQARRAADEIFERNGHAEPWKGELIGSPEQLVERMRRYVDIGFRHFVCGFPSPYDAESMERLVRDVKPELERG